MAARCFLRLLVGFSFVMFAKRVFHNPWDWVPCFRGSFAKSSASVDHRESMPTLQILHAFTVILHSFLRLQTICESMAPNRHWL